MTMLLIDIGNTTMAVASCDEKRIKTCLRISTVPRKWSEDRAREVLSTVSEPGQLSILSSVVPQLTEFVDGAVRVLTGRRPLRLSHAMDLGIHIDYPRPETIGADRLANAVGAVKLFGAPVIVADFGTALTFDVVSRNATYVGGIIVPGLPFMTEYLAERTAMLPKIQIVSTVGGVGRSTQEAMEIGAVVGYRGMVREVVAHLSRAMGESAPRLCATGGNCEIVLKDADMGITIVPDLNLMGLRDILMRNQ